MVQRTRQKLTGVFGHPASDRENRRAVAKRRTKNGLLSLPLREVTVAMELVKHPSD